MIDYQENSINPDPENLTCGACGYESKDAEHIYWDGCIDCIGECE